MAEQVDLAAPITKPAQTFWRILRLGLEVEAKQVNVHLIGDNGELLFVSYPTPAPPSHPDQPTGETLLTTLNTANLTNNSLVRRVFTRLIADGYLAGTITGAP